VAGAVAVNTESTELVGPNAPNWEQRLVSRLSKTNRADSLNGRSQQSIPESRKRPLTDRDGITLRNEVRDLDHLNINENRPISWDLATDRWRNYILDKEDVQSVFENSVGDRIQGNKPHRFHPEYSSKQYAKLKDLERGISEAYGKRLHTTMLTFTASSTDDFGNPLPPVDHLDGLLESWDSIRRSLDRVLDGTRYERLAILEPHKSGYIHIHMAVFVDGKVTSTQFEPVIESHVNNCDLAGWTAHDLEKDDTISVRHAGADRQPGYNHALAEGIEYDSDTISELAIYLAEYLGTYGDDPLDTPEHIQSANAVLWATGRQRWRPSNGAQQHMSTDPRDPDSDWQLVGIETNDEFIPCENTGGGIDTFVTGPIGPPSPPPTDHR
jgi:hypothetical protein